MIPNCKKNEDTDWIDAILTNAFKAYGDREDCIPQYRKVGNLVAVRGVIAPKKTISDTSNTTKIFVLPERI